MRAIPIILCTIAILLNQEVAGQTYSSVTSDKEIYDFLNWMTSHEKKYGDEPRLKRKQIYYGIISWDTTNFISKDTEPFKRNRLAQRDRRFLFKRAVGTDTIFKTPDREFLFLQYTAIKDSVWHQRFSNSKLLYHISGAQLKRPNRYFYSVPLFSVDRKYVLVNKIYYCGALCAYGGYYVYKKVKGKKWKYIASVNGFVS